MFKLFYIYLNYILKIIFVSIIIIIFLLCRVLLYRIPVSVLLSTRPIKASCLILTQLITRVEGAWDQWGLLPSLEFCKKKKEKKKKSYRVIEKLIIIVPNNPKL